MPLKRKRSDSVVDFTLSPPLPFPLTTSTLRLRSDSPTSSSSRSGHSTKHRRRGVPVVDIDASLNHIEAVAGPSHISSASLGGKSPLWLEDGGQESDVLSKAKHGELNAVAGPSNPPPSSRPLSPVRGRPATPPPSNLLSTHTCPICFSTVTNACLTPCGHVLCGACLFASVKSAIQRALDMGIPVGGEGTAARCPVCRALMKGWDGKGGGVIPLKVRTVMAL